MKADSWGSTEQSMACCCKRGEVQTAERETEGIFPTLLAALIFLEFVLWCYLVSCSLPEVKVGYDKIQRKKKQ